MYLNSSDFFANKNAKKCMGVQMFSSQRKHAQSKTPISLCSILVTSRMIWYELQIEADILLVLQCWNTSQICTTIVLRIRLLVLSHFQTEVNTVTILSAWSDVTLCCVTLSDFIASHYVMFDYVTSCHIACYLSCRNSKLHRIDPEWFQIECNLTSNRPQIIATWRQIDVMRISIATKITQNIHKIDF